MKFAIYLILFLSYLLFKYLNKKESKPQSVSTKTPPLYPEDILRKSAQTVKETALPNRPATAKKVSVPFEEGKTDAEPVYDQEETEEEKAFKIRETVSVYALEDSAATDESRPAPLNMREAFIASVIIQRPY